MLVEAARTMLIFSRASLFLWAEEIATLCYTQNRSIIYNRFNKTPYELINDRKLNISFLHVFGALCYPKNDCEDIGNLGSKGDIGFFIGYFADFCAYRVYNRRTKKIMKTMNVTFVELSAMDFEQSSSKPRLQSEFDSLFEAMYDDYNGGQPSTTPRTTLAAQEPPSIYVLEILKNYGMKTYDPFGTLMEIKDKFDLDKNRTLVDVTKYRSMIGTLMYLTSSRPDIIHATCLCARYQAKPIEKHLKEVKRIFHYLWGTVNMALWYTKDSGFELTRFLNANYARCKDTFKSTSGGAQFLGEKLTDYQLADLYTKALPVDKFNYLVRRLGMRSLSPMELERLAKSR
uniref:Uncharacterized mitochondrial protein AtMg00810-like n=1 Tax=Tanacetum cinerariifolium TaxID=118510 RepID=A0A699GZF8_TANCI|nr:uncharacterized mitochondrial protein AtMg00810-like [Tanacetum cinerariifolium]